MMGAHDKDDRHGGSADDDEHLIGRWKDLMDFAVVVCAVVGTCYLRCSFVHLTSFS